tara:strand:- start:2860 stop:3057 length:198 start_codon:yes stop_codon:yes gene_type:complete
MEEQNKESNLMDEVMGLEQEDRFLDFSNMQDGDKTIITSEEDKTKKEEVKSFINFLYKQFQKGGA